MTQARSSICRRAGSTPDHGHSSSSGYPKAFSLVPTCANGVASRWTRVLGASTSLTFSGSSRPPTNSVRLPRGHGRTTRARASIRSFAAHCAISGYAMATYSELRENLARPALLSLRIRAVCGVGARAELLRAFLTQRHQEMTAAELSLETSYRKRNVLTELGPLRFSGLVKSSRVVNADRYSLSKSDELSAVVGPLPKRATRWTATFGVLHLILDVTRSGTKQR